MDKDQQFLKSFGKRVQAKRKEFGISQEKLAEKVGVHRTYIGFIEQGKRNPSIGNINKIAKVLGIKTKELF